MAKSSAHQKLTIEHVKDLGRMLIEVANLYPTKFLSERDFFPLVVAYLTGRIPSMEAEVSTTEGRIDFQLKGTNPTWLELAVQPRTLADKNFPNVAFPGNKAKTLYASQNRPELRKLMNEQTGKTRFLLLVDLHGGYVLKKLETGYKTEAKTYKKGKSIRVVYVSQSLLTGYSFLASAKPTLIPMGK